MKTGHRIDHRRAWLSAIAMSLLGALLMGAAPDAGAGMMGPCDSPIVLPGPRVQVFILPYHAESRLTARGRELTTIMQRHVLFAALKYQSIGVEELTGDDSQCAYERIAPRILQRLKPGQAAIFLRGRLFEQGDSIRLQSTVSFGVPQMPDTLAWNVTGDATGKTSATIPDDPVMFAPRTIPFSFLQTLESAQKEARRLHKTPSADSTFFDLPADPAARFGFEVLETRDDWMHLRLFPSGQDGWVPAHALATAGDLKGAFPELYFVDGLIGYHELLTAASPGAGNRRLLDSTLASFDEYIRQASGRAESEARALATILKGNAVLRATGTGNWSTEQLQQAQRYYQEAQRLAPTSTVANNFAVACTSALCARGACADGPDQLHAQFLTAISRDPTSPELVNNLKVFYEAVQNGRLKVNASPAAVSEQRALVERVQKTMQ